MKTDLNKTTRNIRNNVSWSIIFGGIILFAHPSDGWKTFWLVMLGLVVFSLINNLFNYYHYSSINSKQEAYEKDMNDFKKRMDDFYKKNQQQNQYRQRQEPKVSETESIQKAYKLMQLKLSDDVSTIKKRYRFLAMQWHPDKFASDDIENQQIANRNFQKVNSAYNVIKKYKKFV